MQQLAQRLRRWFMGRRLHIMPLNARVALLFLAFIVVAWFLWSLFADTDDNALIYKGRYHRKHEIPGPQGSSSYGPVDFEKKTELILSTNAADPH
jgi:hypothetical protein